MKKKLLAIMVATVMTCGILVGCGDKTAKTDAPAETKKTDTAKENTDTAKTDNSATDTKKQEVIQVPVTIMNGTDVDFAELYTSGAKVEDWGDNLLGNGVTFAPGGGVQAAFNVDAENLKWDFKAVDANGESLEFNGLDLSNCDASGVKVKLTYDRNTQTGTITAE